MKYSLLLAAFLGTLTFSSLSADENSDETMNSEPMEMNEPCECPNDQVIAPTGCVCDTQKVLQVNKTMVVSVVGQGVAPSTTDSPAQAYALAKRAAIADGYRLIAEKVKGVRVDGQDLIKNMMVKRSTVRTAVAAMVKSANIVETSFKDGLCEVEMEIVVSYAAFQ